MYKRVSGGGYGVYMMGRSGILIKRFQRGR